MNMIYSIALKDFKQHLRSSRFFMTLLLCLLFLPFTLLTGTDYYCARQTVCEQRQATADSTLNNAYVWSQVRPLVIKQTEPLSIFCQGVTLNMGTYNQILLNTYPLLPYAYSGKDHSIIGYKQAEVQGDTGNNENIFLNTFSYTDFTGMIGLVFSLLALVFSYDAFSHEKEAGTLRMIFSHPVNRLNFLFGKIGGICFVLIPPVLLCYAASAGYLIYAGISLPGTVWNGILLLSILTLGFIFVCILIGILVSLLASTSEQALTVSLLLWIGMVFILPPVSSYLAETMAPIPLYRNIEAKMKLLDDERYQKLDEIEKKYLKEEKVKTVMTLFNNMGEDGFMDKWGITASLAHATRRTHAESELIRLAYSDRKWKLQKDYLNKLKRQIRLRYWFSCFSPLQIFQETAQHICRTSPENYLSYTDEVRHYRQEVWNYFIENQLFSSYSYFTTQNEEDFMTNQRMNEVCQQYDTFSEEKKTYFLQNLENRPKLDTQELPRFTQQTANIHEQIKDCLNAFLFFTIASLIFIYITIKASIRYDIR